MPRTKGPWAKSRASVPTDGEYDYAISAMIEEQPYAIAEAFGRVSETIRPDAAANAAFIVLACNSHDSLVAQVAALREALQAAITCLDADGHASAAASLNTTGRSALSLGSDSPR